MVYIVPHINTLIVEIGSTTSKIGYAGDFHPRYIINTPKAITEDSGWAPLYCKIIEEYVKKTGVDSVIYVTADNFTDEMKLKILRYVFTNKIIQSITFLNCRVAEAFGAGKTTASILSCTYTTIASYLVVNGKLAEITSTQKAGNTSKANLLSFINSSSNKDEIINYITTGAKEINEDMIFSNALESWEKINWLKERHGYDILEDFKPVIIQNINKIQEMRVANNLNKKNTSNGCIILCGGLMRLEPFYEFVKTQLLSTIGNDFSDFILRDKELINSFAGASVFGMNNETKKLFITASDWISIGPEVAKLKSY